MEDETTPGGASDEHAPVVDASTNQEGARARAADKAVLERMKASPPPMPTSAAPAAPAATPAAEPPAKPAPGAMKLVSVMPEPKAAAPAEPASPAPAAPTAKEPPAAPAPAPAAAAPAAEPEHISDEPPVEEVNKAVLEAVSKDADCRTLQGEYSKNDKRLAAIVTYDPESGIPQGGELVEVAKRITTIEGLLEPGKAGVRGAPELDEISKDDLTDQLRAAKGDRERLLLEHQRLSTRNETLTDKFDKRALDIKNHILGTARARRQAEKRATAEVAEEKAGRAEWQEAFDGAIPTDLSKEDKAWVWETLLEKANAAFDRGEDIPDFKRWISEHSPRLLERVGRKQGADAAAIARAKEGTTPVAPRGPASVAAPTTSSNPNLSPSERRRAVERDRAMAARHITFRPR